MSQGGLSRRKCASSGSGCDHDDGTVVADQAEARKAPVPKSSIVPAIAPAHRLVELVFYAEYLGAGGVELRLFGIAYRDVLSGFFRFEGPCFLWAPSATLFLLLNGFPNRKTGATMVVDLRSERSEIWRVAWDSNPGDARAPVGFQDRCLRPLGQLPIGSHVLPDADPGCEILWTGIRRSLVFNQLPKPRPEPWHGISLSGRSGLSPTTC